MKGNEKIDVFVDLPRDLKSCRTSNVTVISIIVSALETIQISWEEIGEIENRKKNQGYKDHSIFENV